METIVECLILPIAIFVIVPLLASNSDEGLSADARKEFERYWENAE